MSSFKKQYDSLVDAIVTSALVIPTDINLGKPNATPYYYTEKAAWDTGAQITLISPRLVQALGLLPDGKGGVTGIGGDQVTDTCGTWMTLKASPLSN